jgi:hypothetical protein
MSRGTMESKSKRKKNNGGYAGKGITEHIR